MKAFRSVETGDGVCSIPDTPDRVSLSSMPMNLSPLPGPVFEYPREIIEPTPEWSGFGCYIPKTFNSMTGQASGRLRVKKPGYGDPCVYSLMVEFPRTGSLVLGSVFTECVPAGSEYLRPVLEKDGWRNILHFNSGFPESCTPGTTAVPMMLEIMGDLAAKVGAGVLLDSGFRPDEIGLATAVLGREDLVFARLSVELQDGAASLETAIDPVFLEICSPGSVKAVAAVADELCIVAAEVDDSGRLVIRRSPASPATTINVLLAGLRRGA